MNAQRLDRSGRGTDGFVCILTDCGDKLNGLTDETGLTRCTREQPSVCPSLRMVLPAEGKTDLQSSFPIFGLQYKEYKSVMVKSRIGEGKVYDGVFFGLR